MMKRTLSRPILVSRHSLAVRSGRTGLVLLAAALLAGASANTSRASDADCLTETSTKTVKLVKAQARQVEGCMKDASSSASAGVRTAQRCLSGDDRGRIASARAKLIAKDSALCSSRPPFGYTDAFNVESAVVGGMIAVALELLGPAPNDAVFAGNTNWRCQKKIVRDANIAVRKAHKRFRKCMKRGLRSAAITSRLSLRGCAAEINADVKGKWADSMAKLDGDLTRHCDDGELATALPGPCANASDLSTCLDPRLACQACRMIDTMHDLGIDCDTLDDGSTNGSCNTSYPQVFDNMLTLPITGTTYYVDATCGSNTNTGGSVDCGAPNGGGPWADLSPLQGVTLEPGDAVAIRAGTYGLAKKTLGTIFNGSPSEPIRYYAYNDEPVFIDGEWGIAPDPPLVPNDNTPVLRLGSAYNIVEGIGIQGCNMVCVQIKDGGEHDILHRVTITGGGEDGIKATLSRNNLVLAGEFTAFHNEAIDIWHSTNTWIVGSLFHDNDTSLRPPSTTVWTKAGSANVHFNNNVFQNLTVAEHALMLGGCCWMNWDDLGGLVDTGTAIVPQPVAIQAYAIGNTFDNVAISVADRHAYSSTLGVTGCHHCEAAGNTITSTDDAIAVQSTNANAQPCYPGHVCDPQNDPCDCHWEVPSLDVSVHDNVVRGLTLTDPENTGSPSARLMNMFAEHAGQGITVDTNTYCVDQPASCRIGNNGAPVLSFSQWQASGFDGLSTLVPEAQCPVP